MVGNFRAYQAAANLIARSFLSFGDSPANCLVKVSLQKEYFHQAKIFAVEQICLMDEHRNQSGKSVEFLNFVWKFLICGE